MKKVSLCLIGLIILIVSLDFINIGNYVCDTYSCESHIDGTLLDWLTVTSISIFFLLLLNFFLKSGFTSWWIFAKWAIPVIFILFFLINIGVLHPGYSGGMMGWGGLFDGVIDLYSSVALYAVFVIGSVVQIYRGYGMK